MVKARASSPLHLTRYQNGDTMAQHTGKVAWFNNAKGFGFLTRDGGPDVFCHYSAIQMEGYHTLKEGDEVEFDVIQGAKGPQADKVTRLGKGAPSEAIAV